VISRPLVSPAMPVRMSPSARSLFVTRNHDLTQLTATCLKKLSIEATDSLGCAVSHSTVIRALLRYAEQQDPTWLYDRLLPLIKEEGSLARHRAERNELLQRTHDE
jgi:hypothetical protein